MALWSCAVDAELVGPPAEDRVLESGKRLSIDSREAAQSWRDPLVDRMSESDRPTWVGTLAGRMRDSFGLFGSPQ